MPASILLKKLLNWAPMSQARPTCTNVSLGNHRRSGPLVFRLTISPPENTNMAITARISTTASDVSMPGFSDILTSFCAISRTLGSCDGNIVSMNCSICPGPIASSAFHLSQLRDTNTAATRYYLSTLCADSGVVWITGVVLLMYLSGVLLEEIRDQPQVLR